MSSRRDGLLDSAEDVFCRLGYARTTIAALADAAGVTRPTVYAYFPSKDDVFRALADRVRDEFLLLQERVDTSSPARTVREALDAFLAAYTRHYGVLTVIAHQALADPAMRSLRDDMFARVERRNARFLERLVAAGRASPAIPPADLARAVTGLTARSAERAVDSPGELPVLADQLVTCYLRLAGIAEG
ncbi:TetR/AcrR family transcriptional regulator [Cryptosporangium sp. NPDC048952]|uniref:TetR/AcrR family transcriptional regulator n=1 Tax=Cryptosporangium sp. NPDC048952 TaxID=3363961 RepID=UPI00371FDF66